MAPEPRRFGTALPAGAIVLGRAVAAARSSDWRLAVSLMGIGLACENSGRDWPVKGALTALELKPFQAHRDMRLLDMRHGLNIARMQGQLNGLQLMLKNTELLFQIQLSLFSRP